jgi:predicted kinase
MNATALVAGIPVDALVVLVGPSGSGKSTWAARHFEVGQVLSSDAFRHLVAADAADQAATADAFKVLHSVTRARLRRGLRTVIDATNLTSRARQSLLRAASDAGRPVVAVAFDVSLERCLAQNEARSGRCVPEGVVRRHHREMRAALRALPDEGYHSVHLLQDAEMTDA